MPRQRSDFGPSIYPDCGTYRGWQQHRAKKTTECQPCNAARNKYMAEWRKRTGRTGGRWVYVPHEVELTDDHYSI